jgi:hypothetical protein
VRMISVACARCSCAVRHLNLRLSDRRYRQLVHQVREERQQRREFKEALKEPNSILFSADALCFVDHKYRSLIHQHKPILSNPIARRNPLCPVLLLSGNRAPRGSRFARVQIIHTALRFARREPLHVCDKICNSVLLMLHVRYFYRAPKSHRENVPLEPTPPRARPAAEVPFYVRLQRGTMLPRKLPPGPRVYSDERALAVRACDSRCTFCALRCN